MTGKASICPADRTSLFSTTCGGVGMPEIPTLVLLIRAMFTSQVRAWLPSHEINISACLVSSGLVCGGGRFEGTTNVGREESSKVCYWIIGKASTHPGDGTNLFGLMSKGVGMPEIPTIERDTLHI